MLRHLALVSLLIAGCGSGDTPDQTKLTDMNPDLQDFAARYTAAWCSQDPASVASFFAPRGSLTINDGEPSEDDLDAFIEQYAVMGQQPVVMH